MSMAAVLAAAAIAANVPPTLLQSVCWVESKHDTAALNLDDGGSASLGMCQLKLNTARMFSPHVTREQLMKPEVNAGLAARYLAQQIRRYNGHQGCAVVAYNKGTAKFCPSFDNRFTFEHTSYSKKVFTASKEKPWLHLNAPSKNQARPRRLLSSTSAPSGH